MKKFIILLLCLAVFAGCKKSGSDPAPAKSIVGKWYLKRQIVNTYLNGNYLTRPVFTNDFTGTNGTPLTYKLFNSDGTGTNTGAELYDDNIGTYGTFTYTLTNITLGITYDLAKRNGFLNPSVRTVTVLDDNLLVLSYKYQGLHTTYVYLVDEYYTK